MSLRSFPDKQVISFIEIDINARCNWEAWEQILYFRFMKKTYKNSELINPAINCFSIMEKQPEQKVHTHWLRIYLKSFGGWMNLVQEVTAFSLAQLGVSEGWVTQWKLFMEQWPWEAADRWNALNSEGECWRRFIPRAIGTTAENQGRRDEREHSLSWVFSKMIRGRLPSP